MGRGPALVFSSWLGEAEQWAAFSDEWRACLAATPGIEVFKFSEAAKRKGAFGSRFSLEQRDEKVRALIHIIKRYALTEQFHILDLSAFKSLSFATALQKRGRAPSLNDPYFLPFQFTIIGIAHEVKKRGYTERCEVVFDDHLTFGPRAKAWYPIFRRTMEPPIRDLMPIDVRFESDLEWMPLQAAELTAGLRMRTLKGENDEFDAWIWKELEGFVNVSEFSAVIDAGVLSNTGPFESAEEARRAWDSMEEYLDRFGGDPIQAFLFWVENVKHLRKKD